MFRTSRMNLAPSEEATSIKNLRIKSVVLGENYGFNPRFWSTLTSLANDDVFERIVPPVRIGVGPR
jgi:hypothetical protein